MDYVYVNGYRVPVITRVNKDKIIGIKIGSIFIVKHNCYIPENVRKYLKSRDITIITLGIYD